jgi:hypothetical protein
MELLLLSRFPVMEGWELLRSWRNRWLLLPLQPRRLTLPTTGLEHMDTMGIGPMGKAAAWLAGKKDSGQAW